MRSWERKDIVDILLAHHKELSERSADMYLSQNASDRLDDKCLVIENFLEETWGIEWDGLKFIDSHKNLV